MLCSAVLRACCILIDKHIDSKTARHLLGLTDQHEHGFGEEDEQGACSATSLQLNRCSDAEPHLEAHGALPVLALILLTGRQ